MKKTLISLALISVFSIAHATNPNPTGTMTGAGTVTSSVSGSASLLAVQSGAGSTLITGMTQSTNYMHASGQSNCPSNNCNGTGINNNTITTSFATGAGDTVSKLSSTFTGSGGQALGGVSSAQAGYASATNTYSDGNGSTQSTNVSIGNQNGLGNATTSPSTFYSATSANFGTVTNGVSAGVTTNFNSGDITSSTGAGVSSSVGFYKDTINSPSNSMEALSHTAPGIQGTINVFYNNATTSGSGVGGYGSSVGQSGIGAGYTGQFTNSSTVNNNLNLN